MSYYSGPQPWTEEGKPSTARRNRKRREAEARNAKTLIERTRVYREGLPGDRGTR